ncbi:TerB family tellurite resistance protein [Chryseosolibacter indicus]|uniref:TerB family tellurite resistance protein n=1 Tax=Chryseosolibacter indicus TaxID=2782351 RepID=A0ABS5W090_9BACT|nr:TerB family tellurite resistance protein [Chryseosolibacter indicus]MBT1706399.1 TerB family tellurite resistance protein [Chryseosolibacter indicus]
MTSFFEHQKLSFRKSYFRNLIYMASVDGELAESEFKVLYSIGIDRNLKSWQIEELLKDTSPFDVFIPDSFLNRMNLLYDLMRLLFADGIVDDKEAEYIKQILSSFNLESSVFTELLILFKDGTPATATWREFTEVLKATAIEKESIPQL